MRSSAVAIGAMMALALSLPAEHGRLTLGAGLFVLSDGVLAVGFFRRGDGLGWVIWPVYRAGQAVISWGAVG